FEAVGSRVERLAEFHDIDATLTERGADRRRGIGGAGRHLQLDIAFDLLGHRWPPFALSGALAVRLHGKRCKRRPEGRLPRGIPQPKPGKWRPYSRKRPNSRPGSLPSAGMAGLASPRDRATTLNMFRNREG